MSHENLKSDLGKIVQQTMPDIVEMRLREYLKQKSLKPGDPLPKEVDLAESLGVSRNVVREALSRLRMLGMGLAEVIYARKTKKDVEELKSIALKQMNGKKGNFRVRECMYT